MNTELPVTNRQFLIILLTNAESSVDCCRYNLDLLKLSRWYIINLEKTVPMFNEALA
ncbi:hypothetical protein O5964_29770, partial [Escherichia coli]|nr:hypothetical protein [Escherichia coli]